MIIQSNSPKLNQFAKKKKKRKVKVKKSNQKHPIEKKYSISAKSYLLEQK